MDDVKPDLTISETAIDLIVDAEVSDEGYYARHYQHFDWPGGASGPTVGIGYDCGYCTEDEIERDWTGILTEDEIATMKEAAGIKGLAAMLWVRNNRGRISIDFDAAMQQFKEREMPKWVDRVAKELPNLDKLTDVQRGALVSLAYNRGCSFRNAGDRYQEMRDIESCMENQNFSDIPDLIESMGRLWPNVKGLRLRRMQEADLFRSGLVHA